MDNLVSVDVTLIEENSYTVDLVFEEIDPFVVEITLGDTPNLQQVARVGNWTSYRLVHAAGIDPNDSVVMSQLTALEQWIIEQNYSSFSGIRWLKITEAVVAEQDTGYIIEQNVIRTVVTLPSSIESYTVRVAGKSTNGWRINPPVGGKIVWLDEDNIAYLESNNINDSVELLNISDGVYQVISSIGNIFYSN